jgi:hypothetical protein
MLDIKAAHRHGSLVAYARAIASEREKPARTKTIELATREQCRGMSQQEMREVVRTMHKEVGFLYRLAFDTWWSLATNHRVWMEKTAAMKLAHALVYEMAHGEQASTEQLATAINAWHDYVHEFLNELRVELDAAHLIEREYLGGAAIMFESDERMLNELIEVAEREFAIAAGAKAASGRYVAATQPKVADSPSPSVACLAERAAAMANKRADMARVYVLDRLGECRDATCLMQQIMCRGGLDGSS